MQWTISSAGATGREASSEDLFRVPCPVARAEVHDSDHVSQAIVDSRRAALDRGLFAKCTYSVPNDRRFGFSRYPYKPSQYPLGFSIEANADPHEPINTPRTKIGRPLTRLRGRLSSQRQFLEDRRVIDRVPDELSDPRRAQMHRTGDHQRDDRHVVQRQLVDALVVPAPHLR